MHTEMKALRAVRALDGEPLDIQSVALAGPSRGDAFLPPEQAAAAVVGRSSTIGILEPGMQADLAIFDVADYREIPFCLGANLCTLTMKKGRVIHSARTPSVATVPRLPPQRADTAAGGVQRMSDSALRRQRS